MIAALDEILEKYAERTLVDANEIIDDLLDLRLESLEESSAETPRP